MEEYDGIGSVCPNCGYDEKSSYNNMYLAPGTVLHDRYLVGVLLSFNGEGATYIAYDTAIECKVLLREYMPVNLCSRVEGMPTISVNYNYLAKYKSFMAEFTDLNKSLAKLRNNTSINPVLDMFAENNTTYIIFEYIEGSRLIDYLKDNAGELTWEQVAKLFPPLFTTIGIIHNEGIIHRAISPDTIYVTPKGEIKLSGFCISSIRTIGGGLEPELFKGYAAPEQYSSNTSSKQGTWTDIYGISALLYRVLTGCMPTESIERLESDNLCEPHVLNPGVPKHVSRAIMDGLNVSGKNRIQTVTELVTRLFKPAEEEVRTYESSSVKTVSFAGSEEKTSTYTRPVPPPVPPAGYVNPEPPPPPVYEEYEEYEENDDDDFDEENEYEYEKVNTLDRIKIPIIIGILLFAILMILGITLMHILSPPGTGEESSGNYASMSENVIEATTEEDDITEPTSEEEKLDAVVPDLTRKFFELTSSNYADYIVLEPEYEYNDEYDEGQIFWQELESGSLFHRGASMKVKVSLGSSKVSIPDYSSCSVSEYETYLKSAGIENYQLVEDSYNEYASSDTVTKLEINGETVYAGDKFDRLKEEKLIVYYKPQEIYTTEAYIEPPQTETSTTTETEMTVTETETYTYTETQTSETVTDETQITDESSISENDESSEEDSSSEIDEESSDYIEE